MNVGVAHSEVNPNTRVMNSRGIWLAYGISVGVLHVVLLSIPFFSVPVVWTLTNVIHNLVSQSAARFSPRAAEHAGGRLLGTAPQATRKGTEGKAGRWALQLMKGCELGEQHRDAAAPGSLCIASPLETCR